MASAIFVLPAIIGIAIAYVLALVGAIGLDRLLFSF
ncbi:hypothetical protein X727_33470 [Mesorhizobium sp. L103C119B0]|nr:hypothetical protein X727_33470 [Mesorhizobium sp. L103C119B0]